MNMNLGAAVRPGTGDGEATMADLRLHAASPGHVQKMQVGVLMLI